MKKIHVVSTIIISLIVSLLFLEALFRVLPVYMDNQWHPSIDNPVLRYKPNDEFVWSKGKYFEIITTKKSNSHGFLSDYDYGLTDLPKITIIGDSFVEAMQVENSKTYHGLLSEKMQDSYEVNSLGVAGSPLTNYIMYAEFARQKWGSEFVVISIIGNDFDESLCQYHKDHEGMYCYEVGSKNELRLMLPNYQSSLLRKMARKSALLRYIFITAGLKWKNIPVIGVDNKKHDREFVGNTRSSFNKKRINLSKIAVDQFLLDILKASKVKPENILFVLDGDRYGIYDNNINHKSYFNIMMEYFENNALDNSFSVINMQNIFTEEYKNNPKKFEFSVDSHWNEHAHKLVADQVELWVEKRR